jgi:hypothetical protein
MRSGEDADMLSRMWLSALATASVAAGNSLASLVEQGRLTDADRGLTAQPWREQPTEARLAACRLLLLKNQGEQAAACLESLPNPGKDVSALLGQAFLRQQAWGRAAAAYAAAGRDSAANRARDFAQNPPYQGLPDREVVVPFVRRDPLPVVHVRVNGGPELNFILDTGAADTIIDPELAAQIGVKPYGADLATFAGGKTAQLPSGVVDSLGLGAMTLRRVPVVILDTSHFSGAAGGLKVSGVLGVGLLSQFLSTIDYPGNRLVLRPKGAPPARSAKARSLPMWLAGDHYILTEGALNGVPELSLVDTGLAGAGCTAPQSSLDAAKVTSTQPSGTGQGGGGTATMQPFVATVSLGLLTAKNVPCLAGPFPPSIEHGLGTRIGLLVSHAFLSPYAVTFDFRHMRLVLDPA